MIVATVVFACASTVTRSSAYAYERISYPAGPIAKKIGHLTTKGLCRTANVAQ